MYSTMYACTAARAWREPGSDGPKWKVKGLQLLSSRKRERAMARNERKGNRRRGVSDSIDR